MTQIAELLNVDVNFSSFTFEDLEHPRLIQIYSIFWNFTFVISTLCFILLLYTIIKKSTKEMGGYKWYLCHQLFWSYIFELYVSCLKPITLWPFYLAYSGGILQNLSGKYSLNILCFIAVFMGYSIGISIVHRYVQASPFSFFYHLYENIYYRAFIYLLIIFLLQGGFFYGLLSMPEIHSIQNSIESQNEIMKIFFVREPSLFGFDRSKSYTAVITAAVIMVLFLFFAFLAFLYFNFIRILRKNKSNMSMGTYNLQKILFKTLYIQICLISVILIAPLTLSLILALFGIRWVSVFALFSFMFISIHAIADFITTIYFIKPYRLFITGLMKSMLTKMGIKFKSPITHTIAASTTISTRSSNAIRNN